MRGRRIGRVAGVALALGVPLAAGAGGGPRNVLVVVNDASDESAEIANAYVHARDVPLSNVCHVATSTALTVDKATYQSEIETPILDCIARSPNPDHVDYIVLTRGMPIRAMFPDTSAPPEQPVSITALLQAMDTTLRGKDQEYGMPYGFATHPNTYSGANTWFEHTKRFGAFNLYMATMLSGYWSDEAIGLIDRSVASDLNPPSSAPGATFVLEDGSGAANVRDMDFPQAVTNLQSRGLAAVHVTSADPEVMGQVVASHVTAGVYSANSQAQIASNTYPPGAIVDVLESFGLTPSNFTPGGADQVPVTWWVTMPPSTNVWPGWIRSGASIVPAFGRSREGRLPRPHAGAAFAARLPPEGVLIVRRRRDARAATVQAGSTTNV